MIKSLSLKADYSIDELIERINTSVNWENEIVESSYNYLGGHSNLGFIEHIIKEEQNKVVLLTKILLNRLHLIEQFSYGVC